MALALAKSLPHCYHDGLTSQPERVYWRRAVEVLALAGVSQHPSINQINRLLSFRIEIST
jgi:hypothetical protein